MGVAMRGIAYLEPPSRHPVARNLLFFCVPCGLCSVQTNRGRNRHVEALDCAHHRDGHQRIAPLAGETPQSLAFIAEHPRQGAGECGVKQRCLGFHLGTEHPDIGLLQGFDALHQIDHRTHRCGLGSAARGLKRNGGERRRIVLRQDHSVSTKSVGATNTGA